MKTIGSKDAVSFQVKVLPKSAVNDVVGMEGDFLKIKLTSPPAEGKANESLIEFLSETLGIRKADVRIIKGQKNRIKLLKISNITKEDLLQKLIKG